LTELLKRRPREKVVLGYHFILRQLLECVSQALQIIVQNVNHWINDHGWPSSTTEHGGDIFESR
jgi:exo-beta-1,3-glucanase (GH17 family)